MNRADYFNVDSDAVVFGQADILLLNVGGPLQLYFLFTRENKSTRKLVRLMQDAK